MFYLTFHLRLFGDKMAVFINGAFHNLLASMLQNCNMCE